MSKDKQGNPDLTTAINADHAEAALEAYLSSIGGDQPDNRREDLINLLSSLRHYAKYYRVDFFSANLEAHKIFQAERRA